MTEHQKNQNGGNKSSARTGFRFYAYLFFKRFFDVIASLIVLIAFCWLYLILAIAVKCSGKGKVMYRHLRVGKGGKDIKIPKFRSMKEQTSPLGGLTSDQIAEYRKEYKLEEDPRVTKVGKFLRKTSLDELPQVWSILKGDMSVVGPRPLVREELETKYGEDAARLTSVKPGLFGMWAANGRSNCTYESGRRQELELYYVDHCSCWLDLKIMFRSVIGVVKRDGAK